VFATFLLVATMMRGAAPLRAQDGLPEGIPPPPEGAPPPGPPPSDGAPTGNQAAGAAGRTPPRLSFVDGSVSFWRPGAEDWAPAQVNTPLAPGDALYATDGANLELQIGPRAFVRGGAGTQLSLENQDLNFLQLKITTGHLSLDLRSITTGHTIEIDTPGAAFTIDHTGYYRVDVGADTTTFITRRGGSAAMTPAGGQAAGISPSEQVVVSVSEPPSVATYVAPEVDAWDRWNYDRTDHLIDALSARYVPPGVYGADALDHYGNWREVGNYGPVWVPEGVGPTWAPYSTGRWILDPYYGWTWVDVAPWGWAPYHYGRWVYLNDYWAWAPGPVLAAPAYAPGLVAFFGGGGFGVSVGLATAPVGWVALGWGEPCIPWWGHAGFVGRPWWGGWGGPHVVNNTVINNTTIVNVNNINIYRNVGVHNAVVAVPRDRFGRGGIESARLWNVDAHRLQPIHGPLPVKATAASLLPASGRGVRPPESVLQRQVVGTRPFHDPTTDLHAAGLNPAPSVRASQPRLVAAPSHTQAALGSPRPPFGASAAPERARPSLPPRFNENPQSASPPRREPAREAAQPRPSHSAPPVITNVEPHSQGQAGAPAQNAPPPLQPSHISPPPAQPQMGAPVHAVPSRSAPQRGGPPPAPQVQRSQPPPRPLPGEPANRVYPGHGGSQPQPQYEAPRRAPAAPHAPAPSGGNSGQGRPQH